MLSFALWMKIIVFTFLSSVDADFNCYDSSSASTCYNTTMIDSGNIECFGHKSCQYSSITIIPSSYQLICQGAFSCSNVNLGYTDQNETVTPHNSTIWCAASYSCAFMTNITSLAYCSSLLSCYFATFSRLCGHSECSGTASCAFATIIGYNGDNIIWVDGMYGASNASIYGSVYLILRGVNSGCNATYYCGDGILVILSVIL